MPKKIHIDKDILISAIQEYKLANKVALHFGVSYYTILRLCKGYGIWNKDLFYTHSTTLTKDKLENFILTYGSVKNISKNIGIGTAIIYRHAKKYGFYLHTERSKRRRKAALKKASTLFIKDCKRPAKTVKAYFETTIEYVCALCGLGSTWNNKKLTLQMDHIDGDNTNNVIENLRLLCPNCHTQTETFGSRNYKRRVKNLHQQPENS